MDRPERQTERWTDLRDGQADRQRETDRRTDMTDRWTGRQRERQTDMTNRIVLLHQLLSECTLNIWEYIF